MTTVPGLVIGIAAGFVISWSRLSDPATIQNMLLVREAYVFLVMGSAIAVAAVGVRALRAASCTAAMTGEPIRWTTVRIQPRHLVGSVLFGLGWGIAATCPGPLAAMMGEGRIGAIPIFIGLIAGTRLQAMWVHATTSKAAERVAEQPL